MKAKAKAAKKNMPEGQAERLTVRQYAEKHNLSLSPVRRAIADGFLIVDRSAKPMVITGGEMPLSYDKWRERLAPAVAALRPALFGWSGAGLDVLVDGRIHSVEYAADWRALQRHASEIKRLAARQRGQAA